MYVLSIAKYYTASANAYVSWSENKAIHSSWAWPDVVNQLHTFSYTQYSMKLSKCTNSGRNAHLKYLSDRSEIEYKQIMTELHDFRVTCTLLIMFM